MNKIFLLISVSVIALSASGALAASDKSNPLKIAKNIKVLWDQNSNYAKEGVNSMNFTSMSNTYNNQAADDFVVPRGKAWNITEVEVVGAYSNRFGPATSENVFFYKDARGTPGKLVAKGTFTDLQWTHQYQYFDITLPNGGVRLKSGHYWVSVVANMFQSDNGDWAWRINGTQHRDQAVWQNPGGLSGCDTWCTLESLGLPGPDLVFELKGVSKAE